MENIFSKIIALIICVSVTSCAFDGEYSIKEVAKINEDYNVVKDINTPDYGFMIECTLNNVNNGASAEVITSNCINVYSNKDTIMYSKVSFKGDSTLSYYVIPINPKREDGLRNDPIRVKEATFKNNIIRFNKVNLPSKTSL
jgi:hypothetical protein